MVAKWDMLAITLAQISSMGFARGQHANRGQGAIGTRAFQASIFGGIGRRALEHPHPSQEIVR